MCYYRRSNVSMQGVILAGGFGTRLQSIVNDVPKPMAQVNGIPFLEILLNKLNSQKFNKIVLAVGYKSEVIVAYFGNKYKNIELIYSYEVEPLGTGGAVRKAVESLTDDYVYIFNGDTYFDFKYSLMKTSKDGIIACKYLDDNSRYGSVVIEDNRIVEFKEKEDSSCGYINGGVYLLNKKTLMSKKNIEKFSLENDYFKEMIDDIWLEAITFDSYFIDIGIPSDYAKIQEDLK